MKWSTNTCTFLIIFLIPILAFSLTSTGIFKGNTVIGIDAYAKKSNESSGESSPGGSGSSSNSGSNDKSRGSSSGSDTKSSDNSNNEGSSGNKNNDRGTNNNHQQQPEPGSNDESSNTGADNNLQAVEPPKTGKGEQGTGATVPADKTVTPSPPPTTCEQGSTCTHQQDSSNRDHSNTTTKDKTPFVLSLPFP
jgi:hypothetical protein